MTEPEPGARRRTILWMTLLTIAIVVLAIMMVPQLGNAAHLLFP